MLDTEITDAVDAAAEALGMLKDYDVRISYTARCQTEITFHAVSLEALLAKVQNFVDADLSRHIGDDESLEGDEIAYITPLDDDGEDEGDEIELDCREEGKCFSWDACNLVDELAKLDPEDPGKTLAEFIGQARKLKTKKEVDNPTDAVPTLVT